MWYLLGLFVAWFGFENIKSIVEDEWYRGLIIVVWCVTVMAVSHRMNDLVFIVCDNDEDDEDENDE